MIATKSTFTINFVKAYFLIIGLLIALNPCYGEDPEDSPPSGISVDLHEPTYANHILSTVKGGVIEAAGIRIQAMNIAYSKKDETGAPASSVVAEGCLMVEYGEYFFIGERLEYDFQTQTGIIYNGRFMVEPWYFGGDHIYLCANGSYIIDNAFVTTSEDINRNWEITAERASLSEDHLLYAKNIKLHILNLTTFWLPCFRANLNSILDSPIRYSVKWGGNEGHRFGMVYELFSWNHWKTFLRLDYRIKRGLGGGIETYYRSLDRKLYLETINYAARDSSLIHPGQRLRFRFQGLGDALIFDDTVSAHLSYDKLSDIDMPTDYNDRGLELDTAGRTELLVRKQTEWWIANFTTKLKINDFQTLKQELPTISTSWRPVEWASTGIICSTNASISYLDFAYGNNQLYVKDYSSARLELSPLLYRPFHLGELHLTPEIGGTFIGYSDSPVNSAEWLTLGKIGLNCNTNLSRCYTNCKHVITPYINYNYYTMPTVSPDHHYIFDIADGWYRLNMLQFGISQSLYCKWGDAVMARPFSADLYANAFFDTHTFPQAIPKVYADFAFLPSPWLKHIISSGWDVGQRRIDHYNVRTEWTVNSDIAVAAEFRHRSAYDWRKADRTNFILDSFRSIEELRYSQLSDRRDTFLFHIFYRFHPSWAFQFESRSGWDRSTEPNYNEFEIDLIGTLRSAWNVKLSYQHREDDDRVSFYFSIGIDRPNCGPCCCTPPKLCF